MTSTCRLQDNGLPFLSIQDAYGAMLPDRLTSFGFSVGDRYAHIVRYDQNTAG